MNDFEEQISEQTVVELLREILTIRQQIRFLAGRLERTLCSVPSPSRHIVSARVAYSAVVFNLIIHDIKPNYIPLPPVSDFNADTMKFFYLDPRSTSTIDQLLLGPPKFAYTNLFQIHSTHFIIRDVDLVPAGRQYVAAVNKHNKFFGRLVKIIDNWIAAADDYRGDIDSVEQ